MDNPRTKRAGLVLFLCPCGYQASARSSYAALQAVADHSSVCTFVVNPPTTEQEKKS